MGFSSNIYGLAGCTVLSESNANDISVFNNTGGTVSVFLNNGQTPVNLSRYCCENILNNPVGGLDIPNTSGYTYSWDENFQECRWLKRVDCDNIPEFNIALNPTMIGGEPFSAFFDVTDGDVCGLKIKFDYLFKFDCAELLSITNSSENQQIEQLEAQLSTLQTDCSELSTQLDELNENFQFNYVITDTANTGTFQPGAFYYCVTTSGLPALKATLETIFPTIPSVWNEYLTTGAINGLTLDQIPEQQAIFDMMSDFNDLNQGLYLTPCQATGFDLITATVQTISTILSLEDQVATCTSTIETIESQLEVLYQTPCLSIIDVLEKFSVGASITKTDPNNLQLVDTMFNTEVFNIGETNLLSYLMTETDSGIYLPGYEGISCNNDDCDSFARQFLKELIEKADAENLLTGLTETQNIYQIQSLLNPNYFDSGWKTFELLINDPVVISAITGQYINLNLTISNSCVDFSILIDRIRLDKICEREVRNEILVNKNPGFELKKVCDNKKVWVAEEEPETRVFDLKHRFTEYDTKHHKLVLNSKETTLHMSIAKAIETDVWCYVTDNECILQSCETNTGYTATICCCDVPFEMEGTDITGGTITLPPDTTYNCAYSVGDIGPGGGVVFWVNPNNPCEGMEITQTEIASGVWFIGDPSMNWWTNPNLSIISTMDIAVGDSLVGDGQMNTQNWVNHELNYSSTVAANSAIGAAYYHNGGGFNDWFLPSIEELQLANQVLIGTPYEFTNDHDYWSSTAGIICGSTYTLLATVGTQNELIGPAGLNNAMNRIRTMNDSDEPILVRAARAFSSSPCSTIHDVITGSTETLFEIELTDCSWIYKFDTDVSDDRFDGFWLAGHSDGSLGVYQHISESGSTATTVDYTNVITEDCCISYDVALRDLEERFNIGRHLTGLYWDPSCKQCKFKKCETPECIDLTEIIEGDLIGCTELEVFENTANSNLISINCRKISSSYPLLNLIYQRYINSETHCGVKSSEFNYDTMIDFAGLITTYWVDLIEQVVPSTTIWTNNHIYGNSIYHQQKFVYRTGTVIPCSNPDGTPNDTKYFSTPIPFIHTTQNPPHRPAVDVDLYYLNSEGLCMTSDSCSDIFYYNGDCGSEFIGVITEKVGIISSQ